MSERNDSKLDKLIAKLGSQRIPWSLSTVGARRYCAMVGGFGSGEAAWDTPYAALQAAAMSYGFQAPVVAVKPSHRG